MNEDQITETLIAALARAGPAVTRRFLAEVAGVSRGGDSFEYWGSPRNTWQPVDGPVRGVVVGLAANRLVRTSSWLQSGWGESKVDAAVWDEEVLVLFEVKIRGGQLESTQMIRHATVGALCIDSTRIPFAADNLPAGFAVRTWSDVGDWLERELRPASPTTSLVQLAETLSMEGICELTTRGGGSKSAATQLVDRESKPLGKPLEEIARDWDLRRVRQICLSRYGGELIKADACVRDTKRLAAAYRAAGQAIPLGLRFHGRDGAMTPERVLSVLYGSSTDTCTLLSNAYPAAWTAFRDRTLGSGADRHVLAAMLAWAGHATAPKGARTKIQANAATIWITAPDRAPGLEEIHRELAPARRLNTA